jgi:hypothetical protein
MDVKKILAVLALLAVSSPALAQSSITAKDASGTTQTFKTFNCSSTICPLSVPSDSSGAALTGAAGAPSASALTIQGISGGQAVPNSVADGSDVTLGAKADAVCGTATGTCSLEALTKFVANAVSSSIPAGSATIGNIGQVASVPVSGTLQSAATANGNGTNLLVNGMSSAVLTVNCAACSGGTTVNFEGTEDNTNFSSINAVLLGTNTIAATTTTSGIAVWQVHVAGLQNVRARISAYSAGTITVTGHTVPVTFDPKVINANIVANTATNQSINLAQVNGVTVLTGTGAQGTGSQRVTVATDTATIAGSAPGTAGTASANVLSVQGIASMTPLLANPGTASNWGVQTQGSTTSGQSGLMVQAAVTTAAPSYTTAQTSPLSLDTSGNLRMNCVTGCAGGGSTSNASSGVATSSTNSAAVAWLYGFNGTTWDQLQVDASKFLKVNISAGTVAATQSGTWTVQPGNTANTTAWLMKDSADMAGTTPGTAPANTQIVGAIYNTSAPAPTNGQTLPLQSDSGGNLKVTGGVAQASTTSGQTGSLIMNATQSAVAQISALTSGQTNPQMGDTLGNTYIRGAISSHASVTSLGTALNAKASAGALMGFSCTAITGAAAGYCIAYNATAAPGTGALTGSLVLDTCSYAASSPVGCSFSRIPNSIAYSAGIQVLCSSAVTPFTYTTGTNTCFIQADYL